MDKLQVGLDSVATRETAASETMSRLYDLAHKGIETADRVFEKVNSVCRPAVPHCKKEESEPIRELPPLFADMRDKLDEIEESFRRINDIMSRCEL